VQGNGHSNGAFGWGSKAQRVGGKSLNGRSRQGQIKNAGGAITQVVRCPALHKKGSKPGARNRRRRSGFIKSALGEKPRMKRGSGKSPSYLQKQKVKMISDPPQPYSWPHWKNDRRRPRRHRPIWAVRRDRTGQRSAREEGQTEPNRSRTAKVTANFRGATQMHDNRRFGPAGFSRTGSTDLLAATREGRTGGC